MPFEDVLAVRIRSAGKREEQIRDIPASGLADFERGLIGPGRVVTLTLGYAF
jgi:hypothetical protein